MYIQDGKQLFSFFLFKHLPSQWKSLSSNYNCSPHLFVSLTQQQLKVEIHADATSQSPKIKATSVSQLKHFCDVLKLNLFLKNTVA